MGWKIQGSNPAGTGDFFLLQNMQTGSGPTPLHMQDTGVLSRE